MSVELEGLRHIAETIAARKRILIRTSRQEQTASTDGLTITLPEYIPESLSSELTALIAHEAAHIAHTGSGPGIYGQATSDAQVFKMMNLLEDIRINKKVAKKFPNYTNLLASFYKLLDGREGTGHYNAIIAAGPKEMSKAALLYIGNEIRDLMPQVPKELYAYNDKHKVYFNGLLERLHAIKDSENAVLVKALALELIRRFDPGFQEKTASQVTSGQNNNEEKLEDKLSSKEIDEERKRIEEYKKKREEAEKKIKDEQKKEEEIKEPVPPPPPPPPPPVEEEEPPWEGPPTPEQWPLPSWIPVPAWEGPPAVGQWPLPPWVPIPPWEGPPPPPPPPPWEEPPKPPPPPPPPGPPESEAHATWRREYDEYMSSTCNAQIAPFFKGIAEEIEGKAGYKDEKMDWRVYGTHPGPEPEFTEKAPKNKSGGDKL